MNLFFTLDEENRLFRGIVESLGTYFSPSILFRFKDGETYFESKVSPLNSNIFFLQSFSLNGNDDLFNLLMAIDVFRKNGARNIVLIAPYICYCRQDRKFFEYGAVTFRLVADLLEYVGVNRVVVVDLHCIQTQGFFGVPLDNISSLGYVANLLKRRIELDNLVVVSPDVGGVRRAKEFAEALGVNSFALHKTRNKDGSLSQELIYGNFCSNRDCFIVDDILGTGGTLLKTIDYLNELGAKSISIYITHVIFSGNSLDSFREYYERGLFRRIYVSDSIKNNFDNYPFIEVITLTDLIVEHLRKQCINCI